MTVANPGMRSIRLDIELYGSIKSLGQQIEAEFPNLNALINNARMPRPENLEAPPDDLADVDAMVTTNLLGPIRLTAALQPSLRRQPPSTVMPALAEQRSSSIFSRRSQGLNMLTRRSLIFTSITLATVKEHRTANLYQSLWCPKPGRFVKIPDLRPRQFIAEGATVAYIKIRCDVLDTYCNVPSRRSYVGCRTDAKESHPDNRADHAPRRKLWILFSYGRVGKGPTEVNTTRRYHRAADHEQSAPRVRMSHLST